MELCRQNREACDDSCGLVTPRGCFELWLVIDVTSPGKALCMPFSAPPVNVLADSKLDEKDKNWSGCGSIKDAHNGPRQ